MGRFVYRVRLDDFGNSDAGQASDPRAAQAP